jgi:hypothetical protein
MKLLGEYLEHAIKFERMASEASNRKLKESLEGQATAYRRMAAKRAKILGLPEPSPPVSKGP